MRTQRHQVRRQIIDVTVPDRDLGIRLHEEISGIQRRGLETLIDRCCTEMSTPDRVHRLGRVEVDLGRLSLDNLEQELLEKLYPLLREALADKIREEDVLAAMLGEDPATSARVELVSLFCRTGTLPFWADVSRPRVVDEAVEILLVRNSLALAGLVRELSREQRALERLVRQVAGERLRALFEVLVDAPMPVPVERAGETWELLVMARGLSVPAFMIWIATLQTVCRGENRGQEAVAFFREVLGRTALETGETYRGMVGRMHEEIGSRQGYAARGFGRVLAVLWEELGGGEKVPGTFVEGEEGGEQVLEGEEKVPGTFVEARTSPGFSGTGGTPNSPPRAAQTTGSPPPAPEKLGRSPQFLDEARGPKVPGTFLEGGDEKVPTTFLEGVEIGAVGGQISTSPPVPKVPGTFETGKPSDDQKVPASFLHVHNRHELRSETEFFGVGGGAPLFEPPKAASLGGTTDAKKSGSGRALLLEPGGDKVPDRHPRSLAPFDDASTPSPRSLTPLGEASTSLDDAPTRSPSTSTCSASTSTSLDNTSTRFSSTSTPSNNMSTRLQSTSTRLQSTSTRLQSTSTRLQSTSTRLQSTSTPSNDTSTRSPRSSASSNNASTRSTHHADPDEVYLDTSGLVLFWPFLATFFDRLELLFKNQTFRSPAARCRAVYLLQHLATADLEPPEYRLPLAKVLCGMPLDDVFDPGPELTPIETTECADVLTAILAHATNLGELTIQDFRDGFLLRRGVLSTRDDSWLLRVERAPYDLALDRLPWSLHWIRLPWMTAPIAVEWLR